MTTLLEIVDSALKIGLGALITGAATFLVTRQNHAHDFKKAAREDRRALLQRTALLLEEATALLNLATFNIAHVSEQREAGVRMLIDAMNKLGEAKSLAHLLGERQLSSSIGALRGGVVELAGYFGSTGPSYDASEVNRLIGSINASWPAIHSELESAYAKVSGEV
jgi:hypothetical protein